MLEETVRAPAKINLYLRVLGRRADGYHLLDTLMLPITLYDELRIRIGHARSSAVEVTSDAEAAPGGPTNLAHRAAMSFLTRLEEPVSVEVHLQKRIPVGSGLGGGSSDAAAVLLVLNRMFGRPLRPHELADLGARIGADVSFFVYGCPARIGGVGERVTPLDFPVLHLVICWDRFSLSTKQVYAGVDLSLTSREPESNIAALIGSPKWSSDLLVNDLEAAAARIHPEVLSLKASLMEEGALGALMTGSGAAVFGVWPDGLSAQCAAMRLRERGWWAESVQTLAVSPAVRC